MEHITRTNDEEAAIRSIAKGIWEKEGEIEIDDNAVVSQSERGAYVAAWVWVYLDDDED